MSTLTLILAPSKRSRLFNTKVLPFWFFFNLIYWKDSWIHLPSRKALTTAEGPTSVPVVFLKKAHPRINLRHPDSGRCAHLRRLPGSSFFISKPALKFPGTIPPHIVRYFLRLILSYDPSIYCWPPKIALRAKNVVADSHSGSHRICALALQSPTPRVAFNKNPAC